MTNADNAQEIDLTIPHKDGKHSSVALGKSLRWDIHSRERSDLEMT